NQAASLMSMHTPRPGHWSGPGWARGDAGIPPLRGRRPRRANAMRFLATYRQRSAVCKLILIPAAVILDPAWSARRDIIQPSRGGVSRRRFWIPAPGTYELILLASMVTLWARPLELLPSRVELENIRLIDTLA